MAISSNNIQVYTTLSRELAAEIAKIRKKITAHDLNRST